MKPAPLLLLLGISLFAISFGQNSQQSVHRLIIGTYQYADNTRIKNIEPFAQHVEALLDVKTEVKSYPDVLQLLQAMEKEEVDVVFMNTFGYLMLKEKTQVYEMASVLHIPKDKENAYRSVMVVGKHTPENTLEEVVRSASDFLLVLVNPGSTSGNLVPRLKLAALQPGFPERFFLEIQYTNNHKSAMEGALRREATLSAFGSSEYYALGADTVQLKKLWESPPIPLGPVVFRKALSGSMKDELQQLLLQLHEKNPAALQAIKNGWTEALPADKFMVVDDSYYEELLKLSGNPAVSMQIIKVFAK